MQPNQPPQQPQQSTSRTDYIQEAPIETQEELYDNMVFGSSRNPNRETEEINEYLPTGYLTKDEVDLMREYAFIYSMIERELEQQFDLSLDVVKSNFLRRANTLSMSSKSLQGFALKIMRTRHVVQDENVFQTMGDTGPKKQGMIDKLKNQFGGSRGQIAPDGIMPQSRDVWQGRQEQGTRYNGKIW